jgi:hypothetical protein
MTNLKKKLSDIESKLKGGFFRKGLKDRLKRKTWNAAKIAALAALLNISGPEMSTAQHTSQQQDTRIELNQSSFEAFTQLRIRYSPTKDTDMKNFLTENGQALVEYLEQLSKINPEEAYNKIISVKAELSLEHSSLKNSLDKIIENISTNNLIKQRLFERESFNITRGQHSFEERQAMLIDLLYQNQETLINALNELLNSERYTDASRLIENNKRLFDFDEDTKPMFLELEDLLNKAVSSKEFPSWLLEIKTDYEKYLQGFEQDELTIYSFYNQNKDLFSSLASSINELQERVNASKSHAERAEILYKKDQLEDEKYYLILLNSNYESLKLVRFIIDNVSENINNHQEEFDEHIKNSRIIIIADERIMMSNYRKYIQSRT